MEVLMLSAESRDIFIFFLDLIILSYLLYKALSVFFQLRSLKIFRGVLILLFLSLLAYILELPTSLWLFQNLAPLFLVTIALIFQQEIRNFFSQLGQSDHFFFYKKSLSSETVIRNVLIAAEFLSKRKKGALICFVNHRDVKQLAKDGVALQALVSAELLISIFEYKTPLHDGALLIEGNKISRAACVLPLSEQEGISQSFGTRHRAALGISEQSQALTLVVSEETGAISLAYRGKLEYDLELNEVQKRLNQILLVYGLHSREEAYV